MDKLPKKTETRARILAGAGRTFRSHGYDGSGVDGLAKAAGVTSGAFYAHFRSKADAFRESVEQGMQELEGGVRAFRAQAGDGWVGAFVDFYLSEKRTCSLTESCALQSLTGEVARADQQIRETFESRLQGVVNAAADGLAGASAKARRQQAIALLALLSGGVSLARAVNDPAFSTEIAGAIQLAIETAQPRAPKRRRTIKKPK